MAFNVLVVDDSATIRAVIAKTLTMAEIPVNELYQASNGKEALDILDANWVDVVFADINMPVMDGLEMVDKMSEDGLLKTVPVIVVSTEGSTTRMEELKAKGVSAYVHKPFTPELIREVMDSVMEVRNGN